MTANIFKDFTGHIEAAIRSLQAKGTLPADLVVPRITVEPPRDPAHGDLSSNAGMVLAKAARAKPRDLAEAIGTELSARAELGVTSFSVDGPGFLNLRLADQVWHGVLSHAVTAGLSYGDSQAGAGTRVNVEYVSANPTGPLHVGHARGTVVGDVLATLLAKAGFAVTKEYYINDAGAQVDVLARSAYLRYREALGQEIGEIPEGLYPGDYLVPVGQALAQEHGDAFLDQPEEKWLPAVRLFAIEAMMRLIREDLAVIGVRHDVFTSERGLADSGKVEAAFGVLMERGLVYQGFLEAPRGKTVEDWEPRELTLFRAAQFGDESDRPLKKSDGSWTYSMPDIAYHYDKFQRGFGLLIDVVGVDHVGWVKRITAATKAITGGAAEIDVKLCALVSLLDNGQPVKMSKRAGTFVTLREVVDRVGKDVLRFIMLTRKNDAPLDFDFAKALEQSKDNPVFYVQYAHARAASVLRHAAEILPKADLSLVGLAGIDLKPLTDPAELGLIRSIANWPRLVEAAAEAHEPHRVAFYLSELAAAFHGLWNKGRDDASLRFILADDEALTMARLALVQGTKGAIAAGLAVLGVEPVEEMR